MRRVILAVLFAVVGFSALGAVYCHRYSERERFCAELKRQCEEVEKGFWVYGGDPEACGICSPK